MDIESTKLIQGAGGLGGGGGGGNQSKPRQPSITQDNPGLKTISFAQMQFLLCEGQIQGPANQTFGGGYLALEASTYFDDTPIRTANGVTPQPEDLVLTYGLPAAYQSGVPGYELVSNIIGVDKLVKFNLPISQTITASDPSVSYSARIILTFQGLYLTFISGGGAGDVEANNVNHGIFYTDSLNVTRGPGAINLTDKFAGAFQREYEFPLEGPGPWVVTVYRYRKDDEQMELEHPDTKFVSSFSFSSIVYSTYQRLRYPHSSILTLGVKADQYNAIPAVSIELLGSIIEVPNNYDPATAAYSGLWNGTFTRAYSNNPAWILRDLIINDRYGLGSYIDPVLADKWTLYEIAQYCDGPVLNGVGGYERRFTCNAILQTAEEAWNVLQQFSSIFRGILYYAGASIVAVQDRPKDCIYTFSESNTIEEFDESGKVSQGNFIYSGSAKRARHTVVLVSWDDPDDNYQPRVEYVPDNDSIAKYGYRPLDLRLVGVTSRGQALRAANWALLSEQLLDDTVTFSVNQIGAAIRPGDLVKIADPGKAAIRMGGRVAQFLLDDTLEVDEAPQDPPGGWAGATFSFMAADSNGQPVLRTGAVMQPTVERPTWMRVTWSTADRPQPGWPWLIEVPDRTAQQFRVLSITEDVTAGTYAISALRYRSDIYNAVDFGSPLTDNGNYLWKPEAVKPPTITLAQVIWDNSAKIDVRWIPPSNQTILAGFNLSVASYRLQYQEGRDNGTGIITWSSVFTEVRRQSDNFELISVPKYTGLTRYRVRVASISRMGTQSEWATLQVKTIEEWFPMPDLFAAGSLTHVNLSTGGHEVRLSISSSNGIPPYVNSKKIEFKPTGGSWGKAIESKLGTPDQVILESNVTTQVRASFTTAIPLLSGNTYAIDLIDHAEIAPPAPESLRIILEGGSQSRIGQRRFSWTLSATPFAANWPQGVVNDITSFDIRYRQGSTPDWDKSFSLFSDGISADQSWFSTSLFDSGEWVIMIRTKDRTGWLSDDMAVATVGIGDALPSNVVQRIDVRNGGFAGTITNFIRTILGDGPFYVYPTSDPIYFAPTDDYFYDGLLAGSLVQIDPAQESEYIFQFECAHESAQLIIYTRATSTYRWFVQPGGRDEDRMYAIPLTDLFYGATDGLMYPLPDSATANGWHPYAPNETLPQGIHQLKLIMISQNNITAGTVTDIDVVLDYPDVVFTVNDYPLPEGGERINFPLDTFRVLKAVSVTMQDDGTLPGMATNATIRLKDRGFVDLDPLDSNGNPAAGLADLIAVGY
jgi:predicted phage tail protein